MSEVGMCVKGVLDLQFDEEKNLYLKKCIKCINATAHSQNILHGDTLFSINIKKYKTICAELPFPKVT